MPDLSCNHGTAGHRLHGHQQGSRMRPSTLAAERTGSASGGPARGARISHFAASALGWPDRLEDRTDSQGGVAGRPCLCRGARPSGTESGPSELVHAIQGLRTWMESRQFEGYEPFDLLNSPYLRGTWARQLPLAILLIQFGKRFAGAGFRRWLKVPISRNPKALGLCLSAYCDLSRSGCDVSAEAAWLKSELIRL